MSSPVALGTVFAATHSVFVAFAVAPPDRYSACF
jgi:hypothetical protein